MRLAVAAVLSLWPVAETYGQQTASGGVSIPVAAVPDFQREVRPILAQFCFRCHGPDDQQREAGLRLDTRDGATARLESGTQAIVPRRVDASELTRRIESLDDNTRMPPPATKKQLGEAERSVLKRWIAAGAEYQPHWAFVAPRTAPTPMVAQREWSRGPIDNHVLARLEGAALPPSPDADRHALARRVSLDLVGVPPELALVDEFTSDRGPDAYERYVDRLLASPYYGERWARRWLDLARYADTNGYEKDRPRTIWPYRDWVIRQLNADLPFDQFTVQQLAGDMLPNATPDQRVATGFHRNTMLNEEGGIDPLEFRFHAMVDRLSTTGTAWLGLTLGCAQCHTHKFDPVKQTEYYAMFALLNNADEPEIDVVDSATAARRAELEQQISAAEARLADQFPVGNDLQWKSLVPVQATAASGGKLEGLEDGSWLASGPIPATDTYTVVFDADTDAFAALRLETLTHPSLGNQGPGRTAHGNFVLSELRIDAAPRAGGPARNVAIANASADIEQPMFPVAAAFDGKPATGWGIHAPDQPLNRDRAAVFQFVPAKPANGAQTPTRWTVTLRQEQGTGHVIGRFRLSFGTPVEALDGTTDGSVGKPMGGDAGKALGNAAGGASRESGAGSLADRRRAHLERRFAAWRDEQSKRATAWFTPRPAAAQGGLPLLTVLADHSILSSGDQSKSDLFEVAFDNVPAGVTAVRLEALADERLPKHGPGRVFYEGPHGDFFLSQIGLASPEPDGKVVEREFGGASHSFANGGNGAAAAIDDNKQTGWSINGGQGRSHWAVFNLKAPTPAAGRLVVRLLCERYYAANLGRFRLSFTTAPQATASATPPEIEALLAGPATAETPDQRAKLLQHFLMVAPELSRERQAIQELRNQWPAAPTTLVFVERPANHPRPTFRHHRGEFLQPREAIEPGVPAILPPLPAAARRDRLAFARWIASPANPLTGRVAMNRQWAAFFGRGIVRTTEDFGYQGEAPSHPELLDWLAIEFVRQDWSMKRLQRAIVTSSTYRQSSRADAARLARDPRNELLSRGPRARLEAELVRDAALQASGLWSRRIGGPSVFPPQPENVTTEGAYGRLNWTTSTGADRYRRGLYTFAKRTAPYAMFTTFDGPSGEACVARREQSNTPLQALTLLNDTVFLEAAQALGSQTAALAKESDEARAAWLFARCLSRPPAPAELSLVARFYAAQAARFAAGDLDPTPLAGSTLAGSTLAGSTLAVPTAGAAPATTSVPAGLNDLARRAAWTATARAILNLDEMITKE
jgi:hypothetical protein